MTNIKFNRLNELSEENQCKLIVKIINSISRGLAFTILKEMNIKKVTAIHANFKPLHWYSRYTNEAVQHNIVLINNAKELLNQVSIDTIIDTYLSHYNSGIAVIIEHLSKIFQNLNVSIDLSNLDEAIDSSLLKERNATDITNEII